MSRSFFSACVFGITVTSASSLLCDCPVPCAALGLGAGWEDTRSTEMPLITHHLPEGVFATGWTQKQQEIICTCVQQMEPELPPSSTCVGVTTGSQGSPVLAARVSSLPWEPYLPSFTLIQKARLLLGVQLFSAKAGVFKAAVLPVGIRDVDLHVSGGQGVLLWAASWAFPSELMVTVPSQPVALVSSLPVVHWPLKTQSTVLLQERSSGCLPCVLLSSGCVAQNAWLRSSWQVQAPGKSRFCGPPLLLILLCWFPPPQGLHACRVFGSFHSGLCNIWLYPGFCRAIESGS